MELTNSIHFMLQRNCLKCGEVFHKKISTSMADWNSHMRFCSRRCFFDYQVGRSRKEKLPCKVQGCGRCSSYSAFGKLGYCSRHYQQIKKHGEVLDRTIFDPNDILMVHDHAEIVLRDRKGNEKDRASIDSEDVETCKNLKWSKQAHGYAQTRKGNSKIALHIFILGKRGGYEIDHINGNKLDNRKSNLRFVTRSQNKMNTLPSKANISGIKGIYWDSPRSRWRVRIKIEGKNIHLGHFCDKADAIRARIEAEKKYFGDFARKN